MKKFVGFILSLAMIISTMATPAFAASAPMETRNNLWSASTATPRAVVPPTEMAPNSWYEVYKQFTCKDFVYSSYIFDGARNPTIYVFSPKNFYVVICRPDGSVIGTPLYPTLENGKYKAVRDVTEDFYLIIYNNSSSPIIASDKAEYVIEG